MHNIFAREYKQQENYWTEVLFKFLEAGGLTPRRAFMRMLGLNPRPKLCSRLSFDFQETQDESVPDATIRDDAGRLSIYVEVKKNPGFDSDQARRHIAALMKQTVLTRILLIVTGDPSEPPEFVRFVRRFKNAGVSIRFLSWHDIYQIAYRAAAVLTKEPSAFIAGQYKEFLEMEVQPNTPWAGFSRAFPAQWKTASELNQELAKLVREMSKQVEHDLGRHAVFSGYRAMRVQESPGAVFKRWWLWRRYQTWITVGIGVYENDDDDSKHVVSLHWNFSPKATATLQRSTRRDVIARRLRSSHFYVEDDLSYFEAFVDVEGELLNMKPEAQRRRILSFISSSVRRFRESGVTRVVCRQ